MQIIPIRDLKDTTKVSLTCHQTNKPIFVTKNGYGDMVVMSLDAYRQQQEEILVLQRLLNAKQGHLVNADTVNEAISKIYEI